MTTEATEPPSAGAADFGPVGRRAEGAAAWHTWAVASSKRQLASTLDTALLVFVVLLVLAAGWWVLMAVIGTVLFFAKLAVLALLVAAVIRAWFWVRGRSRRRPEPNL